MNTSLQVCTTCCVALSICRFQHSGRQPPDHSSSAAGSSRGLSTSLLRAWYSSENPAQPSVGWRRATAHDAIPASAGSVEIWSHRSLQTCEFPEARYKPLLQRQMAASFFVSMAGKLIHGGSIMWSEKLPTSKSGRTPQKRERIAWGILVSSPPPTRLHLSKQTK